MQGASFEMTKTGLSIVNLPFGEGIIGKDTMLSQTEQETVAEELREFNIEPTIPNTAMCIDERPYVKFADGVDDFDVLNSLSTYEVPGGAGLSTAKALVIADSKLIEGIDNFWDVYLFVSQYLESLGLKDAGHEGCGASAKAKQSVEESLSAVNVEIALSNFVNIDNSQRNILHNFTARKKQLIEAGFFDTWSSDKHEAILKHTHPETFSKLYVPENDTILKGHEGAAVFVTKHGGFAKNKATLNTGKMFFSLSNEFFEKIADKFSLSDSERDKIYLALYDDALNVSNQLLHKGMPIITDMETY